ncbi:hypothetical protein [uncultured Maritimibacter sp.]|uniref:hypothetical protein n=1 Tax=uncultured Maritimibacter sp. TaxID=991866 RepID=UPI0025916327|nr:hypothetical protein [uncultured Maritimibacter sp.]
MHGKEGTDSHQTPDQKVTLSRVEKVGYCRLNATVSDQSGCSEQQGQQDTEKPERDPKSEKGAGVVLNVYSRPYVGHVGQ